MSDATTVPQQADSAEAQFDDAFAEFAGQDSALEPVAAETHEQEQQANQGEGAGQQDHGSQGQSPDPLADAPEHVRKYVQEMERRAAEAEHAAKSQIGRVSALQKKVNELASKTAQGSGAAQGTPQPGDEEWGKFKEDFPEIAKAVEKRIASLDAKVGQATQPIHEMQHRAFVQSQYAALQAAHPDWQDVAASNEFRSWLSAQPPTIQALITSENAADAAFLIGGFKSMARKAVPGEASAIKEQRKAQLQQAAGVPSRSAGNPAQGGAPDSFEEAFAYFSKQAERR